MALQFLAHLPEWLLQSIRKEAKKRELNRQIRKASLMIGQMPEWQKRDLNIRPEDLRTYKHRM